MNNAQAIADRGRDKIALSLIEKASKEDELLLERNLRDAIRAYERVKGYPSVKDFVERYPFNKGKSHHSSDKAERREVHETARWD